MKFKLVSLALVGLFLLTENIYAQDWQELKHNSGDSTGLYYFDMGEDIRLFVTVGTLKEMKKKLSNKEPYFFLSLVRDTDAKIDVYFPYFFSKEGDLLAINKVTFEGSKLKKTFNFEKAQSMQEEDFYSFTHEITDFFMSLGKELVLKATLTTRDQKTYTYLMDPYEVKRLYDLGLIYQASTSPLRRPKPKAGSPYVYQIDPWRRR